MRQIGYLQRLYLDARSTEHKTTQSVYGQYKENFAAYLLPNAQEKSLNTQLIYHRTTVL